MNNHNGQPHKKWFQRLFNAFNNEETAIEFSIDNSPKDGFIKIFNRNGEDLIKILGVVSNTQKIVVWYWPKSNEPEIINRAIEYIDKHFAFDNKITDVDDNETENFNAVTEKDDEWELQRKLIEKLGKRNTIFPGFDYLFKYEWVPSDSVGKNDLILTNGKGIFAIVETKRIRSKDGKKFRMSFAIRQAGYYKHKFIDDCKGVYEKDGHTFDIIAVIGVGIAEDDKRMCFRPFDEHVCGALDKLNNKNHLIPPPMYTLSSNPSHSRNPSSSSLNGHSRNPSNSSLYGHSRNLSNSSFYSHSRNPSNSSFYSHSRNPSNSSLHSNID
ncbi:27431_t:CDS:1 [Dentiscutata erythropus]|uniref:27431_t:CDS:1 n=1 Tax=Dentiscutata erythropus TaxID=1348616 RepID=A0A9N9CVV6_9GLOM|nr:27431_t:CDS:1 [Dentiscutata erythropus]